ncbi:hypothetical protein N482_01835 [Pseudoalteromonas luteoviolacea NCIMB 1942]|uniref:Uncharacterized protein n=1 Tax=Pseudoalteromonas luteoviolacea NCIMB 1942 TaxID=1365253 RepID=A0A167CSF9_9GAMM|nr:hypothetical protein N482_01835 [Pseudoalteromonas luteoviolacea NCIMB 1942]
MPKGARGNIEMYVEIVFKTKQAAVSGLFVKHR